MGSEVTLAKGYTDIRARIKTLTIFLYCTWSEIGFPADYPFTLTLVKGKGDSLYRHDWGGLKRKCWEYIFWSQKLINLYLWCSFLRSNVNKKVIKEGRRNIIKRLGSG